MSERARYAAHPMGRQILAYLDAATPTEAEEVCAALAPLLPSIREVLRSQHGSPEMAHPRRRVCGGDAPVVAPQGGGGRTRAGGDDRGDQRRDAADDDAPSGDRGDR